MNVIWPILVFAFQYKVVVPKTLHSTKPAIVLGVVVGFALSLFFVLMQYSTDKGTFQALTITFFRSFVPIESFLLANLAVIAVINKVPRSNIKEQQHVQ